MAQFIITVTRNYVECESSTATVKAESPEAALEMARRSELLGDGEMEVNWSSNSGYADPDSYRWTVTPVGASQPVLFDPGSLDRTQEEG